MSRFERYADVKRLDERFLRHLRTVQLVKSYVDFDADDLVIDVVSGYRQFISMLIRQVDSIRAAIIDFPQQLFLAWYFLRNIWLDLKINAIKEAYQKDFLN